MHKKLVLFVFLCAPLVTEALDNKWISPSNGHWEDASWSLGVRPGANQSINITNGGYKAVQISSSTISGYPQTLTISNLYVAAPTNGLSTLLLNYTGLNVPLRVTDGCAIGA